MSKCDVACVLYYVLFVFFLQLGVVICLCWLMFVFVSCCFVFVSFVVLVFVLFVSVWSVLECICF